MIDRQLSIAILDRNLPIFDSDTNSSSYTLTSTPSFTTDSFQCPNLLSSIPSPVCTLVSLFPVLIGLRLEIILHSTTFLGHYRPLLRPTLVLFFMTLSSPISSYSVPWMQLLPIFDSSLSKSGEQTMGESVISGR